MASMAAASATESKLLKRDTMLNDLEDLDPGTLNKVNGRGKTSGIIRYHPQGAVLAGLAIRRTAISVASRSPLPRFHVSGRRQQH